jgi:fructokinase
VSSGILLLAETASAAGSIVFFEPSAKTTEKQMSDALRIADIVKYSDQRYPKSLNALHRSEKTVLEIQTLGQNGLRYRSTQTIGRWRKIPATKIDTVNDTAGAGDWFTASLINSLLRSGRSSLESVTQAALGNALRYATAAAAWSCQFEGARGGMYITSHRSHKNQVRKILDGQTASRRRTKNDQIPAIVPDCPACP